MILALILAAQLTQVQIDTSPARDNHEMDAFVFYSPQRNLMWLHPFTIDGVTYDPTPAPVSIDPTFKRSPKGWMPTCPTGMELIRHDPPPDCFWGTAPMHVKPTEGDFECVSLAQASKLKACPAE